MAFADIINAFNVSSALFTNALSERMINVQYPMVLYSFESKDYHWILYIDEGYSRSGEKYTGVYHDAGNISGDEFEQDGNSKL